MYTFVTGGQRSGRSNYALRRASELGPPPWLYVATGQETDEAIRKRIEHHRRDAEAIWRTAVLPARLVDLLAPAALDGVGAAVFDGLATWIEAQLVAEPGELVERRIIDEVGKFADRLYRTPTPLVVVSTEMGLGCRARDDAEQRLIKVVQSANQLLASNAGSVVLMVSGVPFTR
jgi:adenosylcobinamide kinase/adenosylcobinamide-phosphate guanylyltransferase